jgi:sugar lactone lactonase YvrE
MSAGASAAAVGYGADAPLLDLVAAPDHFRLPAGLNFGSASGVAINSRQHIFVFHRGPHPLMEFDADGNFLQAFGDGLFSRPHGLRIDAEDNIWLTDLAGHIVVKMNPKGRILMVLGVRERPGEWHAFGHLRLFDEPNEAVVGPDGDIFVPQGHGKGENRLLKFDRHGRFIKAWGQTGTGPGEFDTPHSVVIDRDGLLHVADRSNGRIQVFDQDGTFIRQHAFPGAPCGLCLTPDQQLWLAHGHTGLVMRIDRAGGVLGVAGAQGKADGEFGEAHYIAVSARGEVFVADPLNWRVQKFIPRPS